MSEAAWAAYYWGYVVCIGGPPCLILALYAAALALVEWRAGTYAVRFRSPITVDRSPSSVDRSPP